MAEFISVPSLRIILINFHTTMISSSSRFKYCIFLFSISILSSLVACQSEPEGPQYKVSMEDKIEKIDTTQSNLNLRAVEVGELKENIIEPPFEKSWKEKKYRVDGRTDLVYIEGFHYLGAKRSIGFMRRGEKHGKWVLWYESGHKVGEFNYTDGVENGDFIEWFEDGTLKAKYAFKDGQKDKVWTTYHANGKKSRETTYDTGIAIGDFKSWHPSGKVMTIGKYVEGLKEGKWISYHEDGSIKEEVLFKQGVIIE